MLVVYARLTIAIYALRTEQLQSRYHCATVDKIRPTLVAVAVLCQLSGTVSVKKTISPKAFIHAAWTMCKWHIDYGS
jgi:hypothetical protein